MEGLPTNEFNEEDTSSTSQSATTALLALIELGSAKEVPSSPTSRKKSDVEALEEGSKKENQDSKEPQEGLNTILLNNTQVESTSNESGFGELKCDLEALQMKLARHAKEDLINAKAEPVHGGLKCTAAGCGRYIRGRGNFKKHIEWHVKNFDDRWRTLLLHAEEWTDIKKKIPRA